MNIPEKVWVELKKDEEFVSKINSVQQKFGMNKLYDMDNFNELLEEMESNLTKINGKEKGKESFEYIKKELGLWYFELIAKYIENKVERVEKYESDWEKETLERNLDFQFFGVHNKNARIAITCLGEETFQSLFKKRFQLNNNKKSVKKKKPPKETKDKSDSKENPVEKIKKTSAEKKIDSILDDEDDDIEPMERP